MAEDDLKRATDEFRDYMTRGPGEAAFGGIIKAAASNVKRRILRRLETPNLFPHIEHEDRVALERAEQAHERGQKMVDRCRRRTETVKALTDRPFTAEFGNRK